MIKRMWINRLDGGVELWTMTGPSHAPWRCTILTADDVEAMLTQKQKREPDAWEAWDAGAMWILDRMGHEGGRPPYATSREAFQRHFGTPPTEREPDWWIEEAEVGHRNVSLHAGPNPSRVPVWIGTPPTEAP